MIDRPREIRASHLARRAVIYVRQSSLAQVVKNVGSTAAQRAQRRFPEAWGWSPELIEVVDDDLGLSGTATEHRAGYRRLLKDIELGLVGAVFVSDESRLGRDTVAKLTFANLCIAKRVLLVLDGRVSDLADSTTLLQTQLAAVLSHHENLRRAEHIRRGVEARLAAGFSITPPPAGYIVVGKGKWEKDPDPTVREALDVVFRTFPRERSYRATVRALRRMGVQVPRRPRGKPLRFVDPTVGNLSVILKNPVFTGDYHFRAYVGEPGLGRRNDGTLKRRRATPDEAIIIRNHHPAYLSGQAWDEIQSILASNAPRRERRSPGPGRALLQGIVRCSRHQFSMQTSYASYRGERRPRPFYYSCEGEDAAGGRKCDTVPGLRLDCAVIEAVMDRLAPPRLAALHQSLREHRRSAGASSRLRRLELNQLERHALDLEKHLLHVDPAHRHVAATLESKLEQALRDIAAARSADTPTPTPDLTEADLQELTALASDLPALFSAPTTSNSDRKQLIRTLVDHVVIIERSAEFVVATVKWNDDAAITAIRIPSDQYARRRIAELHREGLSIREICCRLGDEHLVTRWGNPWRPAVVSGVVKRRLRLSRSEACCSESPAYSPGETDSRSRAATELR